MTSGRWTRRDFFVRAGAAGSLAVAGPALLEACSKTTANNTDVLGTAKKNGYIDIGIAGEQPYGYQDSSGNVLGEAPDVARAVFKKLGINDVHAHLTKFENLIGDLNTGKFDMVAAGMDITAPRCQQAQFSIPDYSALVAFLVPKGNPKQVKNFDDVKSKGVKLAVENGAVESDFATKSGVPDGQLVKLEQPDQLLSAVESGRAYAAVLTDISLKTLAKQNPSANVDVTPGFAPMISGQKGMETGGFVFRKNAGDVVNQFNTQLKQLHDSGEWLNIVSKYGFTKDNIPGPDVTTEKLCSASS